MNQREAGWAGEQLLGAWEVSVLSCDKKSDLRRAGEPQQAVSWIARGRGGQEAREWMASATWGGHREAKGVLVEHVPMR